MTKFESTDSILARIDQLIVEIYEQFDGKDNTKIRENLMKSVRDLCVRIHYERIDMLRDARQEFLRR